MLSHLRTSSQRLDRTALILSTASLGSLQLRVSVTSPSSPERWEEMTSSGQSLSVSLCMATSPDLGNMLFLKNDSGPPR